MAFECHFKDVKTGKECTDVYETEDELNAHKVEHRQCPECGHMLSKEWDVKRHYEQKHDLNSLKVRCPGPNCKRKAFLVRKSNLYKHIIRDHGISDPKRLEWNKYILPRETLEHHGPRSDVSSSQAASQSQYPTSSGFPSVISSYSRSVISHGISDDGQYHNISAYEAAGRDYKTVNPRDTEYESNTMLPCGTDQTSTLGRIDQASFADQQPIDEDNALEMLRSQGTLPVNKMQPEQMDNLDDDLLYPWPTATPWPPLDASDFYRSGVNYEESGELNSISAQGHLDSRQQLDVAQSSPRPMDQRVREMLTDIENASLTREQLESLMHGIRETAENSAA